MTEKELIQKQIEELQAKLEELEKQEPQMTFKSTGDVDVVFYDQKYYYCMRFSPTGSSWWMRQGSALFLVHDRETNTKLEQLYEDMILDTGGVEEPEEGIWNYDPDAKFVRKQEEAKKLQEKEWTYKVTDEHGESNQYKQYLNSKKPTNLTDLIYDWWEDIFTSHNDLDMETSIDDLVERIKRWFPKPIEETCGLSENDVDWNNGYNTYREYLVRKLK